MSKLLIQDLPVWMSGSSMRISIDAAPSLPLDVSFMTGSIQGNFSHIGSLGGYGSHGHYVSAGSVGSIRIPNRREQLAQQAQHHYNMLEPEHLRRDDLVDLYVKCVELLAGSADRSEE